MILECDHYYVLYGCVFNVQNRDSSSVKEINK